MSELKTFPVPAQGGLDLVSPTQVLAQKPGFAVELNNMEALPEGGYRRIKGYIRYGDIPDGFDDMPVRGIALYQGIVAVVGEYILHSTNGATFYPVNLKGCKNRPSADLPTLETIPRRGSGRVEFTTVKVAGKDTLIITDNKSPLGVLTVDGDSYTYEEAADEAVAGMAYVTKYQDHVVLAGGPGHTGDVVVSARFSPTDFKGAGSWSVRVQDEITGIHVFRDYLYIFCKSSIYRVQNLESAKDVVVRPVTSKIGCIHGATIQEIGGDILFLAADGLRYLGATERIDDVSLTTVSGAIRPIIDGIDIHQGFVSSTVIPSKAQYRLYFTNKFGVSMGVIGTLSGQGVFQWSTTSDMNVIEITNTTIDGKEYVYHIGAPTIGALRIYRHDVGDTFDGTPFVATWKPPYFNFGDSAVRKALHSMVVYLDTTDRAEVHIEAKFDYENPATMQPAPFLIAPVVQASRYGEAQYGKSTYGALRFPIDSVFLEGSGKWVQFIFKDSSKLNAQYTIRGYDLQFTVGGRI